MVSCVRESWPVLVLAPSALRLHWASVSHVNICKLSVVLLFSHRLWCFNADDSTVDEHPVIRNTCMVQYLFYFFCEDGVSCLMF